MSIFENNYLSESIYGNWQLIEFSHKYRSIKHKRFYYFWKCKCLNCENEKIICIDNIRSNSRKYCIKCRPTRKSKNKEILIDRLVDAGYLRTESEEWVKGMSLQSVYWFIKHNKLPRMGTGQRGLIERMVKYGVKKIDAEKKVMQMSNSLVYYYNRRKTIPKEI